MGYDAIVVLLVLTLAIVALAREWRSPQAIALGAVAALIVLRAVPTEVGLAGFSSSATFTVAGLFVVAKAVRDHAGAGAVIERLLSQDAGDVPNILRMGGPVAAVSAVIANTPVVAAMAPIVRGWAERSGKAPSRFLMPLSFATILGGVVTTIGTSTTLVVSGLTDQAGLGPLGFLEITPVGLPVALVGVVVLAFLAPRILEDRRSPDQQLAAHERDYTFRLEVEEAGPYDDATVIGAGLRNLDNVYLARIDRVHGGVVTPVPPDTLLRGGDTLTFVGGVEKVRDLSTREGLRHATDTQTHLLGREGQSTDGRAGAGLVQCVVGSSSPLAGSTLKETSFRGRYGGAVVAIHRAGQRVEGKLGQVALRAGDALLVVADRSFADRWMDRADFSVVVPLAAEDVGATSRRGLVLAVTAAMVLAAATGLLPILHAVLGANLVLIGSRTITFPQAKNAVDIDVLLIIAGAIGLGGAVESSGLASVLAGGIETVANVTGPVGALAAVLVGTLVMTELVTNVAAAALMVPIALATADRVGSDPIAFAIAVAIGASASFLTPIGYQTNTIVYALGGYRFSDYWRLGLPLTIIVFVTAMVTIPIVWSV